MVISIEQAIAAPYCTRQLADLGARVIKVERPEVGDFARDYDTRVRGLCSHFVWTNRSKESLTLDLKRSTDVNALQKLIRRADVFVQNLAPGAIDRMGIDLSAERAQNPKLITCSISGYGPGGDWENRKAYDLLIQAEAGFLSVTGTAQAPAKAGISIADIAAGTTASHNILAALVQRGVSGTGDHLEVSMLEAMTEWMGFPMYYAIDGHPQPKRSGAGHATIVPYGIYETADGSVLFGLQNDREWAAFANHVLERAEFANAPDYLGNHNRSARRAEVDELIGSVLARLTTEEVLSRMAKAGIGTARVNDIQDVWKHPQLKSRNRWRNIESEVGSVPAFLPPGSGSWEPQMGPVPALGEHTQQLNEEFELGL
ncbi:MAG: CaiB/BaiF CoA-transferase family protein [Pseudomonadota bacterium]